MNDADNGDPKFRMSLLTRGKKVHDGNIYNLANWSTLKVPKSLLLKEESGDEVCHTTIRSGRESGSRYEIAFSREVLISTRVELHSSEADVISKGMHSSYV